MTQLETFRKRLFPSANFLKVDETTSKHNNTIDKEISTIEKEIADKEDKIKSLNKQKINEKVHPFFIQTAEKILVLQSELEKVDFFKEKEKYNKKEVELYTAQTTLVQALIIKSLTKNKKIVLRANDRNNGGCNLFHDCSGFNNQIVSTLLAKGKKQNLQRWEKEYSSIESSKLIEMTNVFASIASVHIEKRENLTDNPPGIDSIDITITICLDS